MKRVGANARRAVRRMCDDRLAQSDEGPAREWPWEYYNAFASGGWIGMVIPKKYGGVGLGTLHAGTVS